MDEGELILESWHVLSQYIKDKQQAADHFVTSLIDYGIDERELEKLADNKYLKAALEEQGIGEEECEDELDWED